MPDRAFVFIEQYVEVKAFPGPRPPSFLEKSREARQGEHGRPGRTRTHCGSVNQLITHGVENFAPHHGTTPDLPRKPVRRRTLQRIERSEVIAKILFRQAGPSRDPCVAEGCRRARQNRLRDEFDAANVTPDGVRLSIPGAPALRRAPTSSTGRGDRCGTRKKEKPPTERPRAHSGDITLQLNDELSRVGVMLLRTKTEVELDSQKLAVELAVEVEQEGLDQPVARPRRVGRSPTEGQGSRVERTRLGDYFDRACPDTVAQRNIITGEIRCGKAQQSAPLVSVNHNRFSTTSWGHSVRRSVALRGSIHEVTFRISRTGRIHSAERS